MFNDAKKQKAVETLSDMCFKCGDKHTDECPLAKAITAVKAIPAA